MTPLTLKKQILVFNGVFHYFEYFQTYVVTVNKMQINLKVLLIHSDLCHFLFLN